MGRTTVLMFLAACTHEPSAPPESSSSPLEPLRIAYGTCAPETMQFVAGAATRPRLAPDYSVITPPGSGYGISYATIGQGAGPSGFRAASVPQVRQGALTVDGELDQPIVRRYIRRNFNRIRYCYEKQLVIGERELSGTLSASWTIDSGGLVRDLKVDGFPEVASCMMTALGGIEYPRPRQGSVHASTTFTFDPGEGVVSVRPMRDPKPAPAPDNPFRSVEPRLATCLRQQPDAYGAVVVEFGPQPKAFGVAKPACVLELAKELGRDGKPMRCALAFGDMPFDKLPTLELLASGMFFNGEDRSDAKQAVEQHLAAMREAPLAPAGPIAIAAQPTTPMTAVHAAVTAIDAADLDVAFIAPHAFGGVRLVPPLELPAVPQPKRPRSERSDRPAELSVTPAEAADFTALRARLQALRASTPTSDLVLDVDALTYRDFVRVVDIAVDAGFTHWQLR